MSGCLYCSRPVGCLAMLCDRCAVVLLTAEAMKQRQRPDRHPVELGLEVHDLVADTGQAS